MLNPVREKIKELLNHQYGGGISTVLVIGIIISTAIFRIWVYGDPRLSVATADTPSYISASEAAVTSPEIMTGRRLLTTNLVYKLFTPDGGYEILTNATIESTRRTYQYGLDRIAMFQLIMSLIGWSALAFVFASHIHNTGIKIISTIIILAFGYTPQIADWDSILMAESLTFSLFALQLAILIHIVFTLSKSPSANITLPLIIWLVVFFWWIFLRDTNLLAVIFYFALASVALFQSRFKKNKYLITTVLFLAGIFILGAWTADKSTRSTIQMRNVYQSDLLSSPARIKDLRAMGMPKPNSTEYAAWFEEHATGTFIKFMLSHPGYTLTKLVRDFPWTFSDIRQTYFNAPELGISRVYMFILGQTIHLEGPASFLIDILFLSLIIYLALKHQNQFAATWAWILVWLFLVASLTIAASIMGDVYALVRHSLLSTAAYRLTMWMLLLITMDITISKQHS